MPSDWQEVRDIYGSPKREIARAKTEIAEIIASITKLSFRLRLAEEETIRARQRFHEALKKYKITVIPSDIELKNKYPVVLGYKRSFEYAEQRSEGLRGAMFKLCAVRDKLLGDCGL